jgi:hypothetical protein
MFDWMGIIEKKVLPIELAHETGSWYWYVIALMYALPAGKNWGSKCLVA